MSEKVQTVLQNRLREIMTEEEIWSESLEMELPKSWQKHGDFLLFPPLTFASDHWKKPGSRIWEVVCSTLHGKRLGRRIGPTQSDEYRRPNVEILFGDDAWITKKENGIIYSWDVRKCMFSSGNISEKLRISSWDCQGKVIVDLYAGIGYFTLSYLIHAKAHFVYAIEWNPDSVEALNFNLRQNGVESKCAVIGGDNRKVCPRDVADHVNLGLLPTSEKSWAAACEALSKTRGGLLHIHGNVDTKEKVGESGEDGDMSLPTSSSMSEYPEPWRRWSLAVQRAIGAIFQEIHTDQQWSVEVVFIHKVKSYGPHIDHLVLDLKCTPTLPQDSPLT